MSPITTTPPDSRPDRHYRLVPLLVVFVLPLFPPETRGEGMVGAALGIALFLALQLRGLSRTWLPLPLLVGALLYFPATLLAAAPGAAVAPVSVWLLAAAVGAAAVTTDRDERRRPLLFQAFGLCGCIVAAYGLYQALWGLERLAEAIRSVPAVQDREILLARAGGGRAFAAFPTPAALGGYLALTLAVTCGLALAARGRRRAMWFLGAAVQLAGLVASASLSAGLALGAATLISAAARREWRRRLWAPALAALALAALIAGLRGAEVSRASGAEHPLRLRAANFRLATEVIENHPWIGVGPGGFGEVYPQYRQPGDNESRHVHDLVLELCAEYGVPLGLGGAALFLWLFLAPLVRPRREEPLWVQAAAVGLGAVALQGLLDFAVLLPSLLWSSALLRGWLARHGAVAPRPLPRLVPALSMAGVAVAAGLAALGGVASDARFEARQYVAAGRSEAAAQKARRATRLAPWDPDGWLYAAQIAAGPDPSPETDPTRLAFAMEAVERAVAMSPVRPSARMTRARLRAATGDIPGAYADASAAARLYPLQAEYASARDELGRLLTATSQGRP